MQDFYYSFVVDALASHYYQAELLLYSLQKNAKIKKENIIIHCLNKVDEQFINFLKNNDYQVNIIKPFLDGQYSNKLQQLSFFQSYDNIAGVVLLDTDMFVLDRLTLPKHIFSAKLVDGPNPSLKTLDNIYRESGLTRPEQVECDWKIPNARTYNNNFNGGLYCIPKKYLQVINKSWKKWAEWLYNKEYLFSTPAEKKHIDQISMGMALVENKIKYKMLRANDNLPIHSANPLVSFDKTIPIKVLHYHREINQFGYLNYDKIVDEAIYVAISKANKDIYKCNNLHFFDYYNKSINTIKYDNKDEKDTIFEKQIETLTKENKFKIYLHAGSPKTGTTTLQFFCDTNQKLLEKSGIYYPKKYLATQSPKHQWLVSILLSEDYELLYNYLTSVCNEAEENGYFHSILLSTEGIFNHWWDFSPRAKNMLHIISKYFNLIMVIFFRTPISFLDSFYRQNLKNPQIDHIAAYGHDLSFQQMYNIKWFRQHLDYLGFIHQAESLVGKKQIKVFEYSDEVVKDFFHYLGVKLDHEVLENTTRKNLAQSEAIIEMLRVINRYPLDSKEKKEVVRKLYQINDIISRYSDKKNYAVIMKEDINMLVAKQKDVLKNVYNIKI